MISCLISVYSLKNLYWRHLYDLYVVKIFLIPNGFNQILRICRYFEMLKNLLELLVNLKNRFFFILKSAQPSSLKFDEDKEQFDSNRSTATNDINLYRLIEVN